MLKGLPILVIFAITVNSGQKNQSPDLVQRNSKNKGTQVILADGDRTSPQNNESSTTELPHWYTSPEWWLCILGVPTLIFLGWQAQAAKIAAEALMRSERAWLLLDGENLRAPFLVPIELQAPLQKQPAQCEIPLRNCGNTPASAIDWQFELQISDSTERPASTEIYERKPPKESLTPFPIGQDRLGWAFAELSPQRYINKACADGLSTGTKTLWLCGVARYHDVFEQRKWTNRIRRTTEMHKTFVCLRYISFGKNSGRWVLGGPPSYNKAT